MLPSLPLARYHDNNNNGQLQYHTLSTPSVDNGRSAVLVVGKEWLIDYVHEYYVISVRCIVNSYLLLPEDIMVEQGVYICNA